MSWSLVFCSLLHGRGHSTPVGTGILSPHARHAPVGKEVSPAGAGGRGQDRTACRFTWALFRMLAGSPPASPDSSLSKVAMMSEVPVAEGTGWE